jgi:hypothetical protein
MLLHSLRKSFSPKPLVQPLPGNDPLMISLLVSQRNRPSVDLSVWSMLREFFPFPTIVHSEIFVPMPNESCGSLEAPHHGSLQQQIVFPTIRTTTTVDRRELWSTLMNECSRVILTYEYSSGIELHIETSTHWHNERSKLINTSGMYSHGHNLVNTKWILASQR